MIFAAFMAEMRHPMDFWKSLLIAEVFIYVVYMFFGIFVYSYQVRFVPCLAFVSRLIVASCFY